MASIKIKQVKSGNGYPERQKKTLRALGLNKLNRTIEVMDNVQIRGMIAKVAHLVTIVN